MDCLDPGYPYCLYHTLLSLLQHLSRNRTLSPKFLNLTLLMEKAAEMAYSCLFPYLFRRLKL